MSGNNENNYGWISTLRGFAALLVFFAHPPMPWADNSVGFVIGRTGVAIFFLIMGYLAVQARQKRTRKQYLYNRFVRMYPVFWLILVATYITKVVLARVGLFSHIKDLLFNMTLFNKFFGSSPLIGTSWMMPIQVCFFVALAVLSADFFEYASEKTIERLFIAGGIGAVLISLLRFITHNDGIPTAFVLLIMFGLIGIQYKEYGDIRSISRYLEIYAAAFVPSVILSYRGEFIRYIVAYVAGIALFVLADKYKVSVEAMNKLGSVGFSFFLVSDIPQLILEKIIVLVDPKNPDKKAELYIVKLVLFIVIKFAASLGLAHLLTKYVEKPMLAKAKSIEMSMK
jgi:peptidoglycan/LPS O-acetylase OafA/YrhL